jgi:hypothetical protein
LPTAWLENRSPKKLGEGYFSGHTAGKTLGQIFFFVLIKPFVMSYRPECLCTTEGGCQGDPWKGPCPMLYLLDSDIIT